MTKIMNGRELANEMRETLAVQVSTLKEEKGITPGLAVIIVGDDPASHSYVRGKQKACEKIGMHSVLHPLSEDASEDELLEAVNQYNHDDQIHGILVQLPLPHHMSEMKVIEQIKPEKDVDGFHPISTGRLMTGQQTFLPCTPNGIMQMLDAYEVPIQGKHAVIIGRSNIVGKPIAQLLLSRDATVTICHSKTKNMKEVTKQADIVIAAVGRPEMVDETYIKEGACVIDVGINRVEDGSLVGDVAYNKVEEKAGWITPVPRGVGPMTITMLLYNTVQSLEWTLQEQK
ncbi:bifunctional methylenetetrahydrofolate dehydrogenase/methenyltetrahydrofolate cyclohydrolase FolD [Salsuginibacillus kocurii]|uniref:bifunctional methylenetetrahydrofolate dehydrogenase/methenyltetrahydrofolate cyclohydrolase FolD n=1 Tax=Salsuginibacillus kocurii TaxID=427078 RepID=UPI0003689993|nr:bifunctional methylenetetrahydrofolate dehydrogenase/methenyltetrahydrofolate cyclohydrolase FolD [Salsuginibacillus kocurii]